MGNYLKFAILWAITGSPVTALIILLLFWLVADWYTTGFGRGLVRLIGRARRGWALERILAVNPHDRRARAELGEILVDQRRWARAIEVLKPVLEADPGEKEALFSLGRACFGIGNAEAGELFLVTLEKDEPGFRQGEGTLALARGRLQTGNVDGAIEALQRFLAEHPANVEARYLLSRALLLKGDAAGARRERRRAWDEHASAPRFSQRQSRLWAWKARPERPALYLAVALLALGAMLPKVAPRLTTAPHAAVSSTPEEDGPGAP